MTSKFCVDSNVWITAWQHAYPPEIFASLWRALSAHRARMVLIAPIFEEIEPVASDDQAEWSKLAKALERKAEMQPIFTKVAPFSTADQDGLAVADKLRRKYPLRVWLRENGFAVEAIGNATATLSLRLEKEYTIIPHGPGASENDIRLIAYAALTDMTVVTLEEKEEQKPKKKSNYKIPLICAEQKVRCIDFVGMLKELSISL